MIVGTAGHIDHGKTSLVRALTGVDTDRLKEEKERGISIDLGFAYLPTPNGDVIGFVDVPGHEDFVRNMLAGVYGIEFALLVIAADDGVMPQTREHLAIIDLLGIREGTVALTKADLVAEEARSGVVADIRNLLAGTTLADLQIAPVSTVTGLGLTELRGRLFAAAEGLRYDAERGRFRLAVDRSFILQGVGTVVTGTVLSGAISAGDRIVISPSGLLARVRTIHANNKASKRGYAGERCALNLVGDGITKEAVKRGDVVLDPVLHAPADRIDVKLRLLPEERRPITQWMPVRLYHGSAQIGARVVLLRDRPIAPGETALVQLVLERPIAAAAGDHYVLRDTTDQRTIGGGELLDLRAPARKRRTQERMAQLRAMEQRDPVRILSTLLRLAPFFVDLASFIRDHALSAGAAGRLITEAGVLQMASSTGELGLAPSTWLHLKNDTLNALQAFHAANPDLPGIGFERLRMQLIPCLPAHAFSSFLRGLARNDEIGLDGAWVRLAGHEAKLTPADEKIWLEVQPMISGAERFRPPRVRDIARAVMVPEVDLRRLLKLLGRMGKIDEVAHDHFFLRATVGEMVGIATRLSAAAPKGEFTAAQLRDRLDNGRKVAIQILEFFDRHGVTLRRGDLRRINRHRINLFGAASERADDLLTTQFGRDASPVGRPDFKSGKDRETVLGGFDSLSLPPTSENAV
jgi:selenocysteine-specific elongation factor